MDISNNAETILYKINIIIDMKKEKEKMSQHETIVPLLQPLY